MDTTRATPLKNDVDEALEIIAEYAYSAVIDSQEAHETAIACLAGSIGCGILSLQFPECTKLLGPVVTGTNVPKGARVPGTNYELDPIRAAFNIGTMIRWLDFNDTFLAAEWGHPSDNLGGILAVADFLSRMTDKAQELTSQVGKRGQSPATIKREIINWSFSPPEDD